MLISNFNLCKTEWLDLVFDNRNKEYGAFAIRQHYAGNVVKAMAITFIAAIGVTFTVGKLIAAKPATDRFIEIDNSKVFVAPPPPKKVEPPKPKVETQAAAPAKAAELFKVNAFPPPVVTANPPEDTDLPKVDDNTAVGQVTSTTGGDAQNADTGTGEKGGAGVSPGEGVDIEAGPMLSAEKMPEPMNGMQGWTTFLQNTIRYPGVASTNGISGKVIVSFIVEKDGQLTNFKLERGQGYGLDEEAIRVLKLAKPWKPGMQNGRPVRVKLTLPIAFMLEEN